MTQGDAHFYVNPYDDPVIVKVDGKASFLNSSPIKEFFDRLAAQGKAKFIIDFQKCTGMDSTFLGILAGLGIKMMNRDPKGTIVLSRLNERNLELVKNLGLHRLVIIDEEGAGGEIDASTPMEAVEKGNEKLTEIENARLVLHAHESFTNQDRIGSAGKGSLCVFKRVNAAF